MNSPKLQTSSGAVHKIILDMLSSQEWISGPEILEVTGQKYYDRRVRELREEGWDIKLERHGRISGYRLVSLIKAAGKKRTYPNANQKRQVLSRDECTCQLCSLDMRDDDPSSVPQIDHRIPLLRDGDTEVSNLQVLCSECNVVKRGACKNCKRTNCEGCIYAYPEKAGRRISLTIPPELDSIFEMYLQNREEVESKIIDFLRKLR
jgi:5-methylcytosine-specific restriction endonuclease McrA